MSSSRGFGGTVVTVGDGFLAGGPGTAATMKRWPSLTAATRPRLSIAFIAFIGFFNQFSQIIFCKKWHITLIFSLAFDVHLMSYWGTCVEFQHPLIGAQLSSHVNMTRWWYSVHHRFTTNSEKTLNFLLQKELTVIRKMSGSCDTRLEMMLGSGRSALRSV